MNRFFKFYIVLLITILSLRIFYAQADEPIKMARFPAPSPDGKSLIFSYQGDLWRVSIDGGQAVRLTVHQADDSYPVWSPDGTEIAFSSNRFGNDDIYVMPANGGTSERVTFFSGSDRICDWSSDGKTIFFTSNRDFYYNRMPVMCRVKRTGGGTPTKLIPAYVNRGKLSRDGNLLVYSRGRESWVRKHYRGSANADIWLYNFRTKKFTRLTEHNGNDYYPLLSADNKTIYYVTDQKDDSFNLWQMDLNGKNKKQLTFHKGDGVRFPSISYNVDCIAYERGTDIYVYDIKQGKTEKIKIYAPSDEKVNLVETKTFSKDATEMAVSPDEKKIAFVVHGEIFVTRLKKDNKTGKTVQLTKTPAREKDICWAPNSDTLVFVSDRNGSDDIFMLYSDDPEEKDLTLTMKIKQVRLTKSKQSEFSPKFSPDGDKISYIKGLGDLHIMDVTNENDRTLLTGWSAPEYEWSPDSKWIAYSREDNEFNGDIFIVPADGGKSINITQHPDYDRNPVWSDDGRKLGFVSRRYGDTYDIWFVFLQKKDHEKTKDEWEIEEEKKGELDKNDKKEKKAKKNVEVKIDFKNIHKRLRRLTSFPGSELSLAISPDGKKFVFSSNTDGKYDVYSINWDRAKLKRLTTGGVAPSQIKFDKKGKKLFYLSKGTLNSISVEGKDKKKLSFTAKMKIDHRAERAQKFDEAWMTLNEHFYDPNFHGIDWDAMKMKYRLLALKAGTITEFNNVVSMMLGELNASHLGIRGPYEGPSVSTGMLGLRFDEAYRGEGLKVKSVLPNSPCDKEESQVYPGEILTAINSTKITGTINIHQLLNDEVGEKVEIEIQDKNKKSRSLVVRPISKGEFNNLEYDRWVNAKRKLVDKLSNGKLGYVHIRGMSMPSVEQFEMELYSVAHGKDGLIIDVRYNGGGSTADIMLAMLAVKPHAYTIPRGGGKGYPQGRIPSYYWSKPIVAMCNEWSFSNAEIFPHAIKGLKRGKVVGAPTGGLVISTGGIRLIDGATFRVPFRGWYALYSGLDQELNGCIPDVIIWEQPGDAAKGIDRQLQRAVEELLKECR